MRNELYVGVCRICVGVCEICGKQIRSNYTHRKKELYCTMCNMPVKNIIVYEMNYD